MREKIHGKNLSVFTCSKSFMLNHFGVVRGEEVVKAIRKGMPAFSLTGDLTNKKHVIIETFPTGITLGLFPDAFPIKYKIKHKVAFETTKTEMGRIIDLLKRLSDFNPPVHNIEDFFNHSSSIQAMPKKGCKNLEDKLDAFLCAYAAYWLANHKGKVFGDDQDVKYPRSSRIAESKPLSKRQRVPGLIKRQVRGRASGVSGQPKHSRTGRFS